jgi:hypothetical protein
MSLTWPEIIKLFPARESLVSDIPAGDGKNENLFLQCTVCMCSELYKLSYYCCLHSSELYSLYNNITRTLLNNILNHGPAIVCSQYFTSTVPYFEPKILYMQQHSIEMDNCLLNKADIISRVPLPNSGSIVGSDSSSSLFSVLL